jgi:hypothetical protein
MADLVGPGEVTHLWMTINSLDPDHFINLVLRVYYDGNDFPSVESPLGDFFGLGMNQSYYYDTPVLATGTIRGLNSFWPMPFRKSARFELTNQGDATAKAVYYYVDWRQFKKMPKNTAYFHAQYRQAFPNVTGENYTILETEGGCGHYVGSHLSVHTQVPGWWGEGDDIFIIDGEARPSIWGTGSEDYYCGAWCYGDTFYTDYFGMPLRTRDNQKEDNLWNVYRYHLESPIAFKDSLSVQIEHGTHGYDNARKRGNNNYSSVAYWYMEKPTRLLGELPEAKFRKSVYIPPDQPEGVYEGQFMDWELSEGMSVRFQDIEGFAREGRQWLFNDHLFGNRGLTSGTVELSFETSGTLMGEGVLMMTSAPDYGIVRVELDGDLLLSELNLYNNKVAPLIVKLCDLELEDGEHRLVFTVIGKDERSTNYRWGLDYLRVGGEPPDEEQNARIYE